MGSVVAMMAGLPIAVGLLVGVAAAPTDAAAVNTLLRRAGTALPERLSAVLEVESGLNDPMSIFLTIMPIRVMVTHDAMNARDAALPFIEEMAGGALFGLAGGWLLSLGVRRLPLEAALKAVLVFAGALTLFGLAQLPGTSGFMAVYLAGIVTGAAEHRARQEVQHFLEGMAWLAQIVLFLMLGLLVTPHELPPFIPEAVVGAAVLVFVARPVAVTPCLIPFGFNWREAVFASWAGCAGRCRSVSACCRRWSTPTAMRSSLPAFSFW